MDGYLSFVFAFNEHVNNLEQEPDQEHDFNYYELLQESFVYPIKSYIKAATNEWVAEGIRCGSSEAKADQQTCGMCQGCLPTKRSMPCIFGNPTKP